MSVYSSINIVILERTGEGGPRNRGLGTPSGRSIAASGSLSLCSFVAESICLPHGQKRQLLLEEKMTYLV